MGLYLVGVERPIVVCELDQRVGDADVALPLLGNADAVGVHQHLKLVLALVNLINLIGAVVVITAMASTPNGDPHSDGRRGGVG